MTGMFQYFGVLNCTQAQIPCWEHRENCYRVLSVEEQQALQRVLQWLIVGACRLRTPNDWKELHKTFDTNSVENDKLCVKLADEIIATRKGSVQRKVLCGCF